jgi:hypothetical protein
MTLDPQLAVAAALAMGVAWTMVYSGVSKHALELKRRRRICPSCGRHIDGAVCREH